MSQINKKLGLQLKMDKNHFWITLLWFFSQGILSQSNSEVTCGNAKQLFETCFANDSSNLTKISLKSQHNIPFNIDEIKQYCNVFERGLYCYNEYADKCILDPSNRRLLEGEILPAKNFYEMLCKDQIFVRDYLKHSSCFRYVEKDWDACTKQFHVVAESEFTRTQREKKSNINTQYMHFCCARYAYENCVGNSAKAKCRTDSAKFTRSLVELLSSERQFKNCGRIEETLCGSAGKTEHYLSLVFIGLTIKFLFLKTFNSI